MIARCIAQVGEIEKGQTESAFSMHPLSTTRSKPSGFGHHCSKVLPSSKATEKGKQSVLSLCFSRENRDSLPTSNSFCGNVGHLPGFACPAESDPRHASRGAASAPRPLPGLGRGKNFPSLPRCLLSCKLCGGGDGGGCGACKSWCLPRAGGYPVNVIRAAASNAPLHPGRFLQHSLARAGDGAHGGSSHVCRDKR